MEKSRLQQSKKVGQCLPHRQGLLGSKVRRLALNAEQEIYSLFQSSGQLMTAFELGFLSDVLHLLSEEDYSGGGRWNGG